MWPPSQAYFLQKRRGVGPLCCLMPSWICVDTSIPSPGVIDKEGADTIGVHSSQTITFWMMITSHFFNGIKERSHVFIPLEFNHQKDTRPMWRTAFFSYLDGVWEWVQVISDHMANHYTLLAHAYATIKSIISNTYTSFEHSASNRVLFCSYSTFSLIIAQGRGHNSSKGFHQECEGPPLTFRPSRQMNDLVGVPSIETWQVHPQPNCSDHTEPV